GAWAGTGACTRERGPLACDAGVCGGLCRSSGGRVGDLESEAMAAEQELLLMTQDDRGGANEGAVGARTVPEIPAVGAVFVAPGDFGVAARDAAIVRDYQIPLDAPNHECAGAQTQDLA